MQRSFALRGSQFMYHAESAPPFPLAATRFILVWMAIPTLFRVATVLALVPVSGNWQNAGPAGQILLAALPQDLFIAVQALCLIAGVKFLLPRRSRLGAIIATGLATLVFLVVHLYLLVDFLLYF